MFGMNGARRAAPSVTTKPAAPRKKTPQVAVTVRLSAAQRDKLALLGGDAWLREAIDAARPEAAFAPDPQASE